VGVCVRMCVCACVNNCKWNINLRLYVYIMVCRYHNVAQVREWLERADMSATLPSAPRTVNRNIQCVAVCCSMLQYTAVCCSVLQCVAVRCSALQCVAVCCSGPYLARHVQSIGTSPEYPPERVTDRERKTERVGERERESA